MLPDDEVDGPLIRFMWDYGCRVPLWDAGGLVPQEQAWLIDTLGLTPGLARDIEDWGTEMNEVDAQGQTDRASLRRRAVVLVERLADELAGRYEVQHIPWS